MSYLGYIIQKNGGAEKHIAERMRRAMVAMKQTWSIGERIFADDYERRIKMFNVSGKHGSIRDSDEGWGNEERMEKIKRKYIKRKYIKWILKLDRRTPNYILEKETKMKELRMEAIKRAVKYE